MSYSCFEKQTDPAGIVISEDDFQDAQFEKELLFRCKVWLPLAGKIAILNQNGPGMKVRLRKSMASDLEVFFTNQADDEASFMAAFTSPNPKDKKGYLEKWTRLRGLDSVNMQTILLEGEAVGCVVKFVIEGNSEITYAIDKRHWGKGIVSIAVQQFLEIEKERPILGRVVNDNRGSQRILEKAGFKKIGTHVAYANGRGEKVEEYIYRLT